MSRLKDVICVSGPHMSKIILVFEDGSTQTAGPHTRTTFGYVGEGSRNFSSYLAAAGFAFTDATQFVAPRMYRSDGTTMDGTITGNTIVWTDGTTTQIPKFPF